jgi:hypothetical protein
VAPKLGEPPLEGVDPAAEEVPALVVEGRERLRCAREGLRVVGVVRAAVTPGLPAGAPGGDRDQPERRAKQESQACDPLHLPMNTGCDPIRVTTMV